LAVKRIIVSASAIAVLTGLLGLSRVAWSQDSGSPQTAPGKIGLIDMAHVFKNYDKFKSLREDLKAEIMQSDQKAKEKARQLQALQAEMKKFKEGTPGYLSREKKLVKLAAEFSRFVRSSSENFCGGKPTSTRRSIWKSPTRSESTRNTTSTRWSSASTAAVSKRLRIRRKSLRA